MAEQSNDVVCEKCGTIMIRAEKQSLSSLEVCPDVKGITSVNSMTSTAGASSGGSITSLPYLGTRNERSPTPIRIAKYVCPSCKWDCQRRV